LDFCFKYRHPPQDADSLEPFLQKLASKNQTQAAQEQVAHSASLFYETVKNWPAKQGPTPEQVVMEGGWDSVYQQWKEAIRIRQYSSKTLSAYRIWTEQFRKFLRDQPPVELMAEDAVRFLTYLATDRKVVASTPNQAFNARLFLYRHILKVDYDLADKVVRARRTRYIPAVLTREEVDTIMSLLEYPFNLAVGLLYGCGPRLFEFLNIRIGCINFDDKILTVHDGKGKKDRT
jgi:site-specific recombinase XerD